MSRLSQAILLSRRMVWAVDLLLIVLILSSCLWFEHLSASTPEDSTPVFTNQPRTVHPQSWQFELQIETDLWKSIGEAISQTQADSGHCQITPVQLARTARSNVWSAHCEFLANQSRKPVRVPHSNLSNSAWSSLHVLNGLKTTSASHKKLIKKPPTLNQFGWFKTSGGLLHFNASLNRWEGK